MTHKKQKEKERRRARKLADESWQAVEEGNLDLAEKLIRRAVSTQIENPVLWNDQGLILQLRGKEIEGEASFRSALRLAPTYAEAHANLAALRARQGYLEQAVALQEQAVAHGPEVPEYRAKLQAYRTLAEEQKATFRPAGSDETSAHSEANAPAPAPPARGEPCIDWPTRLAEVAWDQIATDLTRDGYAVLRRVADAETCRYLRELFPDDGLFVKTVEMDRPDYGKGVYRYFSTPIPRLVHALREAIYPPVAAVANTWQELLNEPDRYPGTWDEYRDQCHRAGQTKSTPILLKYSPGGFNALHRDLRGAVFFPIQLAVVLSPRAEEPDGNHEGFVGGDFVFADVPERPKSRRREIRAGLGDALLFCTRDRLVSIGGAYGLQPVMHGVTPITAGNRFVLGVPFHEYR